VFKIGDRVRRIPAGRRGEWSIGDRVVTVKFIEDEEIGFHEDPEETGPTPWLAEYFELAESKFKKYADRLKSV
jgi:hypothetical protein